MRYFLDFEFIEDGRTIDPISIGMISEDGRLYYAEFPFEPTKASDWVKKNVIPQLKGPPWVKPSRMVKDEILKFVGSEKPEFWGYYADYDWVCFCQIFGRMIDLPKSFPKYCRDIKQLADDLGNPQLPIQEKGEHNALEDAKWNLKAWKFLKEKASPSMAEMLDKIERNSFIQTADAEGVDQITKLINPSDNRPEKK